MSIVPGRLREGRGREGRGEEEKGEGGEGYPTYIFFSSGWKEKGGGERGKASFFSSSDRRSQRSGGGGKGGRRGKKGSRISFYSDLGRRRRGEEGEKKGGKRESEKSMIFERIRPQTEEEGGEEWGGEILCYRLVTARRGGKGGRRKCSPSFFLEGDDVLSSLTGKIKRGEEGRGSVKRGTPPSSLPSPGEERGEERRSSFSSSPSELSGRGVMIKIGGVKRGKNKTLFPSIPTFFSAPSEEVRKRERGGKKGERKGELNSRFHSSQYFTAMEWEEEGRERKRTSLLIFLRG